MLTDAHDRPISPAEPDAVAAQVLIELGRMVEATSRVQTALARDPRHGRALAIQARIDAVQTRADRARRGFDEARAVGGDDDVSAYYDALSVLDAPTGGPLSHETGETRRIEPLLEQMTARHPSHADAWALLGRARLHNGNPGAAIQALNRAYRSSFRQEYALLAARAHAAAGDAGGARRLLPSLSWWGRTAATRVEAQAILAGLPADRRWTAPVDSGAPTAPRWRGTRARTTEVHRLHT